MVMTSHITGLDELTERIIGCAIEVHRILMNFNSTTLTAGLKRVDHPDRDVKKTS